MELIVLHTMKCPYSRSTRDFNLSSVSIAGFPLALILPRLAIKLGLTGTRLENRRRRIVAEYILVRSDF